MQYVFIFFLLLLVGSAIGYVISRKDIISAPTVLIMYIILGLATPNDAKDIVNVILEGSSYVESQIYFVIFIYLLLTGLIFGISIRFAKGIFDEEKTPIGYGVIAGGMIVALFNCIWLIKFSLTSYDLYNRVTNLIFSWDFNIPELYNVSLWTFILLFIIAANYINRSGLVTPNLKISAPVTQGNLIKRKADVVVYSDDLELLDSLVLSGKIRKDKYQQIIVDIEMQDLSPHFNAKVELKEEVKPEAKEEVKPEAKEENKDK